MGHILSLFTYLLTTSVSGRVPGYPSHYPVGTRVINYPDTAALTNDTHWFTYLQHYRLNEAAFQLNLER